MMPTTTVTYTTSDNYTKTNTVVSGGVATLALNTAPHAHSETFTSDVGFTYDNTKAEFVGGVLRQKDQVLASSTLYNEFTSKDALWSSGSGVGTLGGTASVSAGVLNIPTGTNNYLEYNDALNMPSGNTGCVRFTYTPAYSGSPATSQYLFSSSSASNNINNLIRLQQIATNIRIDIYNSTGTAVLTSQTGNTWNPTSGQSYEFELNWDTTLSEIRLFIDGVLINGTKTGTGTLGSRGIIRLGKDYTTGSSTVPTGTYDNFIIFDTVQHTSNYTPGAALPATRYYASSITNPEMTHTGPGSVVNFTSFTSTEVGAPRYTIQINQSGNYLYWNGSSWLTSNGTYSQANDITTFNANFSTLPIAGYLIWQIKIHFTDSNTQSSVDTIITNMIENVYYASGTIKTNSTFDASLVTVLTETVVKPTNTNIKYAIETNGSPKYWNGTSWAVSDLVTNFNTAAEINTNLSSLLTENSTIKLVAQLSTTDLTVTPSLDENSISYNFGGVSLGVPQTCVVYGYVRDLGGTPISSVTVTVKRVEDASEYREATGSLLSYSASTTTNSLGYWQLTLVRSSEFEGTGTYKITFLKTGVLSIKTNNGNPITFSVPDTISADFSTLVLDI